MNDRLRIGVLLDAYVIPAWARLMLEKVGSEGHAELVLVVLNAAESPRPEPFNYRLMKNWHRLPEAATMRALRFVRRQLMDRRPVSNDARAPVDAADLFAGLPTIKARPRQSKFRDEFEDADVEAIRRYELDVLVRLGFRVLTGSILHAARHGVWSYHHGDNRVNRGGPPGFWEAMESWPETGTVLQILTEDLDGGTVLYRSWSCTNRMSVRRNNSARYWTSASFLPRMLARLQELGDERFAAEIEAKKDELGFYCHRLYGRPDNVQLFSLICRKIIEKLRSRFRYTFWFDQWILLYAYGAELPRTMRRYRRIVPPRDRFWADPFVVLHDGRYHIFIEELPYQANVGHIALMTIDESGRHTDPVPVIKEGHHLSYPFVFEVDGTQYMVAEAMAARIVPLYRCERFPDRWVFVKNLMEDVAAVDPTILNHDGKWYLFLNIAENPGSSEWDELFVFIADDPINGQWRPHPLNPVVSDVKTARPAGRVLNRRGVLYRPSQDCSHHYGYGLNFNRIRKLSETDYEEELTASIVPRWDPLIKSVHTFSQAGKLSVMDAQLRRARHW